MDLEWTFIPEANVIFKSVSTPITICYNEMKSVLNVFHYFNNGKKLQYEVSFVLLKGAENQK